MTGPEDRPVRTGSLRRRVVFAVVALLMSVLLGLGTLVTVLLGDQLRSDARNRLVERASFAALIADESPQSFTNTINGGEIAAEFTKDGVTYRPTGGPEPGRRPGPPPPHFRTAAAVSVTSDGPTLVATTQVAGGTLTLRSNTLSISRTLSLLTRIELAAGAGTLLVAAVVLYLLVGAALSPLDRVSALAARIRDGARGRRLRPTQPGTELGRTAAALDAMLDSLENAEAEAQDAEARMRRLLADVSHDLRTPLAGVIAASETLLREDPGRVEREVQLVDVIREARRAARLVDDLLLSARLDHETDRVRAPLDLAGLARQVADRSGIDLQARSVIVLGDADRLTRVLTNLVSNARAAGAPVRLEVSQHGSIALVDVHDSGPGVPEADREVIFDRFVRLDEARGAGGSGLGLPIARAIARAHGGDLRCLPSARGAWFRLTLPAQPESQRDEVGIPAEVAAVRVSWPSPARS